jgi:hypothetical protein
MANNLIQIKRSLTTAAPGSLANGELAFTANGGVLFIGSNSVVVPIAGTRNPGVLTANQALVANSTSSIDKVIVANLAVTSIFANGSSGTANQALKSNGSVVYWADDAGDISAVTAGNGLTGGGTTGALTIDVVGANGINVTTDAVGVTTGSTLTVNTTGIHVNTANLSVATSQLTGDVALGTQTSGNYVATITAGNGISGSSTGEGGTPTIAVVANNGITSNSTGVFARAANGTSVDSSGINVVGGNGLVSNSTGVHVGAANGINVAADAVGVTTGSTLTVNATGIHVNSALSISDLTLSGNLTVQGTLTTIDTTSLVVKDPMLELANGNASDINDIGFYGNYNDGTAKFTGLFRDATDGVYKLYVGLSEEPTTTVNATGTGYTSGTLNARILSGGLVSNATSVAITANSTVNVNIVANTLSLSTALPATSGGTGRSTYTSGDIIVANTGNALSVLALNSTAGKVLQSNGTALVYDDIDGGTF